jgi:acetolactate synthase-1/2/3 large subunit
MMSLLDSKKIKFIIVRHEQAAAFIADVYGRITQKVGVCLSTLGPGATNLTTAVANANMLYPYFQPYVFLLIPTQKHRSIFK